MLRSPAVAFSVAALGAFLLLGPAAAADSPDDLPRLSFNDHIRPLLSDRCFFCHGPDENTREAGLRLDVREEALEDVGSGPVIVPGDPDASLLIERVTEADEDLRMPPDYSNKEKLSEEETALLRRWIAEGAEYQSHWAFAPLQDSPPPDVADTAWPSNPIDRFVLAPLERRGIRPSPPADRAVLIRRLYLDLTGLLPDPAEVDAFERDGRPDAYERLVERLLASPHYAERWGRHWLDQARYADSNGYSIDSARTMWPFRDWVIRAIADDMPFRQFTIEQLAGDLLPDATKDQRIASAFHRNTLINQEGGTDREQFRHEAAVDRVNTTGAVWLGLTLGCAQCHTHKFDPISHREFYELFAFFNSGTDVNNTGTTIKVGGREALGIPASPTEIERRAFQAEKEQQLLADLIARQQHTDSEPAGRDPASIDWTPLPFDESNEDRRHIDGDARLRALDDGSLLVEGTPDAHTGYSIDLSEHLPEGEPIGAIRLRVLTHDSLPKTGPGTASNGNFVLTGFNLRIGDRVVHPVAALADHAQDNYPVTAAIDGDPKTGWAINKAAGSKAVMNADHDAVFVFRPAVELKSDEPIRVELHHRLNADYLVGRFALDVSSATDIRPPQDAEARKAETELRKALEKNADRRNDNEKKAIVDSLRKAYPADRNRFRVDADVNLMVMADLPEPRKTYISIRGDFLRPDTDVGELHPGGLAVVTPPLPAEAGRNRLDLAQWLVDEDNALVPRVTVNRVWMRYFGRGLVETEEDFGTQGTPPSHPQLLDWLSRYFLDHDTSMKSLHRLIVTSSTYRQSSEHRADLAEIDPRNVRLARQNRVRVEAEIVRDAALSAAGRLDRTIGGPSVHPPQPDGVYAFTQNAKNWRADTGAARFRRGMYTEFFRSAPHPLFSTFDAPDFQTVCTRRARSNTPLQALTVANDEAFVELARAAAGRVLRERPDETGEARLEYAFRLSLGRRPTANETAVLKDLYDSLIEEMQSSAGEEVAGWLGVDPDKVAAAGYPMPASAAGLVAVCRALFNTDNFITRE